MGYLKKFTLIGIFSMFLILTTSCSNLESEKNSNEIISQKVAQKDKIPITVLVKYAFSINSFEKIVEEKFPQIDIIQVGNYTTDRGLIEYERRLQHDDLTDIVMTWPLEIGKQYWKDRLIDLSSMEFTDQYHLDMLNKISMDGKLYYLPGPSQVRGIVYNKTMFEENGWQVPSDFEGFISLCKKIEQSGIRSIQLGFKNPEVLDTAFVGYSFGDCFSKPKDSIWLQEYNKGIGSIKNQMEPAFDTFERMIQEGIWKAEDLDISYSDREKMLFSRKCAMIEDSVLMARMGYSLTGTNDEFALMPFFSPNSKDDWARLYMVCYIGLNKHLEEPQNKEKYELILELLNYISTKEGQEALASDTGAMYSSVKDVPAPNIPEIQNLIPSLTAGRYAIFPEFLNSQTTLREGLSQMLKGTSTKDKVINMVDVQNKKGIPVNKNDEVIGTASKNFTLTETGNFITDAMRIKAKTDIALFLDNGMDGRYNGKGVSGKIYKGEQLKSDVIRIFPDLKQKEKGVLQKVMMTGSNLIKTLEYAIPVDNNNTGWFYYFSGLKMEYNPTAPPGKRIHKVTDDKGRKIDLNKEYSIAVMDNTLPKSYIISMKDTNISIIDLLIETIQNKKVISPSNDNRFIFINS